MKLFKLILFCNLRLVAPIAAANAPPAAKGIGPTRPSFSQLDTDYNGFVTLQEFLADGAPPYGNASDIFTHIDADSDGLISQQEISNHKLPRPVREY